MQRQTGRNNRDGWSTKLLLLLSHKFHELVCPSIFITSGNIWELSTSFMDWHKIHLSEQESLIFKLEGPCLFKLG